MGRAFVVIRGRIADPIEGWVSLEDTRTGEQLNIHPEKQYNCDLLKLNYLADYYDLPDLVVQCNFNLFRMMSCQPSADNVRRLAQGMRKRPRTEAADTLLRTVKRKMHDNPDLLDAFFNDDI